MQIKLDYEKSLSFFAKLLHAKPKKAKLFTTTTITLVTALGVCEREVMCSFNKGDTTGAHVDSLGRSALNFSFNLLVHYLLTRKVTMQHYLQRLLLLLPHHSSVNVGVATCLNKQQTAQEAVFLRRSSASTENIIKIIN